MQTSKERFKEVEAKLKALTQDGMSKSKALDQLGVKAVTYYGWRAQFKKAKPTKAKRKWTRKPQPTLVTMEEPAPRPQGSILCFMVPASELRSLLASGV